MKKPLFSFLFFCTAVFVSLQALCQTSKAHYAGIRIFTENDILVPSFLAKNFFHNTDDNYTGGLKAELITNLIPAKKNVLLNPLKGNVYSQSFFWGVTAFTPQNLATAAVDSSDRPYASYTFFGFGASSLNNNQTVKLSYEIALGSMGKSLAGEVQSKLHREHWLGSQRPVPQGWHNQIADGGTFAMNARIKIEKKIYSSKLRSLGNANEFKWVTAGWRNEVNAGQYLTGYSTDIRFYFFNINNPWGEYEDDPTSYGLDGSSNKARVHFYVFATPRIKFVGHNTTLTGQLLDKASVYTLQYAEVKKFLFEYDFGILFRYSFFRLGYNLYGRSREFKKEDKSFHNWGGIYASFIFKFK